MKLIFLIIILFFAFNADGQIDTVFVRYPMNWESGNKAYSTDTILTEHLRDKLVMAGTAIIPNTKNQWAIAVDYNLMLESVSTPVCVSDREIDNGIDYIKSIEQTDSTFTISTMIHANCCYNFLCDVTEQEGGVLNLTYIGYGWSICGCLCVFKMDYTFSKSSETSQKKISGIVINGDLKTLKNLD